MNDSSSCAEKPVLPPELDARQVASDAWERWLEGMQSRGELMPSGPLAASRPSKGWDHAAVHRYIASNTVLNQLTGPPRA